MEREREKRESSIFPERGEKVRKEKENCSMGEGFQLSRPH